MCGVGFLVVVRCPFAVHCCEVLLGCLLSSEILVVGTDRSWNTEIHFVMTYLTAQEGLLQKYFPFDTHLFGLFIETFCK
jgi:hypothetical protein